MLANSGSGLCSCPLAAGAGSSPGLPAKLPRKTCALTRSSPPTRRPDSGSGLFPARSPRALVRVEASQPAFTASAGSSPGLPASFPASQPISPQDLHAPTKIYCHEPTGLRIWTFSCPLAAGAGLSLGLPANFHREICTLQRRSPAASRSKFFSRTTSRIEARSTKQWKS